MVQKNEFPLNHFEILDQLIHYFLLELPVTVALPLNYEVTQYYLVYFDLDL